MNASTRSILGGARGLFLSLLLCTLAAAAHAQRNTTLMVPFPPGGGADQIARVLARIVSSQSDAPWVVINRPGAGGDVAMGEMMRAAPDGQTLLIQTAPGFLLSPLVNNVPWKGPDDVEPIAMIASSPVAFFVRNDAPWKTMQELIEHSRRNPTAVSYGGTGSIGMPLLRYVHLKELSGAEWNPIGFTGDGEVVTAVLGGHVTVGAVGLAGVTSHVKAGTLRLLAVPEDARLPTFPDVPTFKEMGFPVIYPNYIVILAPKGTPPDKVAAIRAAILKAGASEEYKRFCETVGALAEVRTGNEFKQILDSQFELLKKFVPKMAAIRR